MKHSITSLAKKARVTVRTLRHYDQIGLFEPSIRMTNGKRIYSDEDCMRLMEIVFFKRIGISLPKIKDIFGSKNILLAATSALMVRKQVLAKEIEKLQRHTASIDTILPQYKNCNMNQKERFEKFCSYQTLVKEIEDLQIQKIGQDAVEKAKKKVEALSGEKIDEITDHFNKLMREFIKAVELGLNPASKEVQKLIQWNYDMMAEFHLVTKEIFLKLRDHILEQKECYSAYHPELPEFLYKAMDAFATKQFKDKTKVSNV
jgi:MerR family transcriptional regulator, thiopeptide resistance regulator